MKTLRLHAIPLLTLLLTSLLLLAPAHSGSDVFTYLPVINYGIDDTLTVNLQSRADSLRFFQNIYLASEGANAQWTGDHDTCNPGDTAQSFRDAILLRINYFRAMAGIPPLEGLNPEYNQKAQQAALMMSVNAALSHDPPPSWQCYTADGDQAAGSSNLYLGVYGVPAIDGYIRDPGAGNYPVGHRRWILYPYTRYMGTGDIPPANGRYAANALWVFDADRHPTRPDTREPYVAWPPPGYVPYQVVYPRWSFAYPGADLSAAYVTMTRDGVPLALSIRPVVTGYGDNTLVWEPHTPFETAPTADVVYTVQIQNVRINGNPQTFNYTVTIFDPESIPTIPALPLVPLGEPPQSRTAAP